MVKATVNKLLAAESIGQVSGGRIFQGSSVPWERDWQPVESYKCEGQNPVL